MSSAGRARCAPCCWQLARRSGFCVALRFVTDLPAQPVPPQVPSRGSGTEALYGRGDDLRRVVDSRAKVLLLTGDSGVGKSSLLAAAQSETEFGVAPSPVTVGRPSGALQHALMESLAAATAEVVERRGLAAEVGQRLKAAALAVARDRGERLAQVVGAELLNLVKGRLGEHAGDALGDYLAELRAAGDEQLVARIRSQMDPTVAEVVIGFAQEVAELAGDDGRVVLALDGVEELGEEDRRLLADLAGALPAQVQLRLGFATYTEAQQGYVEDLLAVSDAVMEESLAGISVGAIQKMAARRRPRPEHGRRRPPRYRWLPPCRGRSHWSSPGWRQRR